MFCIAKTSRLLFCALFSTFTLLPVLSIAGVKCIALGRSSTCEYIAPVEWQSDWSSRCNGIDVSGVSVCANLDNNEITGNGAVINTVWKNSDPGSNRACFCRIISPVVSRWVYAETYEDADGQSGFFRCAQWCQHSCAGKIADTVYNANFHNNILGQFFE